MEEPSDAIFKWEMLGWILTFYWFGFNRITVLDKTAVMEGFTPGQCDLITLEYQVNVVFCHFELLENGTSGSDEYSSIVREFNVTQLASRL